MTGGGWRDLDYDPDDEDASTRDDIDTFPGVRGMVKTPKALVCMFPEWGGDADVRVVVPDSVIADSSEVYKVGDIGKLVVRGWWTERALEERKSAKKLAALRSAARVATELPSERKR